MKTEDLIADLANRATPVRPLAAPGIRALGWAAVAAVCVALSVLVFGARPDLARRFAEPEFLSIALIAFATSVLAVLAALVLAIPAAERSPILRVFTATAALAWAVTLLAAMLMNGHGFSEVSHWYICFARAIGVALIPGVLLVGMLRRAAPLRPVLTSALALSGATAMGALAMQLVCPIDDAGHALIGHFGPVVALGAIGAAVAGTLLRPRSAH